MRLPDEVRQIFTLFYPGSDKEFATLEGWISDTVSRQKRSSQIVIKQFLDDLLSGRYSDEDIERVWRSVSPSYDFTKGGHRNFLTEVRDEIARSLGR